MTTIKFSIIFLTIFFWVFGAAAVLAQGELLDPEPGLPTGSLPSQTGAPLPSDPSKPKPSDSGPFIFPNPLAATTFSELVTNIADFLLNLALAFAFFMIIWAGFKFVTAGGNDEKITSAKKNFTWIVVGLAVILASKALIGYIQEILGVKETTSKTFETFLNKITGTLDLVIVLLFSLTTVYFIWGVILYVMGARGDDEKLNQGKRHMIWGIIGMAIMASAWGIVELISAYVR